MATQLDILDAFNDDMQSLISDEIDSIDVSTASNHVGLARRYEESVHPFIAFERNGTPSPVNRGMGDNRRVVSRSTDADGNVIEYTYSRAYDMELSLSVLFDDNDMRSMLELSETVRDRIDNYGSGGSQKLSALHPDVRSITIVRTLDSTRTSDNIVGQTIIFRVRYDRLKTETVDAMETIEVSINELDSGSEYYSDDV
jgi:hypothetical protein